MNDFSATVPENTSMKK